MINEQPVSKKNQILPNKSERKKLHHPGLAHAGDTKHLKIEVLLYAIKIKYGYDFSHYSRNLIEKKLTAFMQQNKLYDITEVIKLFIDNHSHCFEKFLLEISISVTSFFRDPSFYDSVRKNLLPILQTYPFLKIWHAGCSTGQEVYSMAMLLDQFNLLKNTNVYATDINSKSLTTAKAGAYTSHDFKICVENYSKFSDPHSISKYFNIDHNQAMINTYLQESILFSYHNLMTDHSFGEMNVIFCRNVLIYFSYELQNKVLTLFYNALRTNGYLCLGKSESIIHFDLRNKFEVIDSENKIYKKI